MRRLLRCLDTHFGLYVEHAHKLLHMQQFLRADGRPLRGDTLQQLAQLFQNILAGDPFALEDRLRLRHLLPGGDISATGCGGLLHGKRVPALFHSKRAFRPRPVNWRARHGFRRSRQERRCRRCSGATLTRGPWLERLIANGLDILTLVAISLIFMVEMFLLLSRSLEARLQGTTQSHAHRSALFRPLMFVFILAMDMTISFIPLRMAELTTTSILPRDVLLGLPISAEMGMTGLSVLIAGTWMKRKGARPPLMTGIICMALGYLASMLAWTPWLFIAARALVGLGYGLSLLTAQAYTVRDGKLADMFAGVYAGSLCGSALGAMLAERLGYGPVFAISAVILACLALVPLRLLRGQEKQEDVREEAPAARLTLPQIRRLLADRHFLAFILLALLPSALLCVGFLNYFLPVFLKQADVAQSNIGRIYMLNCLIVIYSGPLFARLVGNSLHKGPLLFWAGILSALSVACFCFLPPLPASVAGSILLGLATGLNIPAQSEFLLELDIARAIGVDQAMSLLDALQRVGQVIGPVCVGAVMAIMSVDDAARWAGIILVAISLLFLLLVRPARHSGDRA